MKTALVIGATGLVGHQLVQQLLQDDRFHKVKIFVRRSTGIQHQKLEEHLIDFDASENWRQLVTGDVLFSALGTTLRTAGSKGSQFKVDYTYQYVFAKAAAQNGVGDFVLISSAYASPDAKLFYSRMKGELERDVQKLSFQHLTIIRPGILAGKRKENRLGESIGVAILNVLHYLPGLKKLKPISASTVAKAMINASIQPAKHLQIFELNQVFDLADLSV